jgi:flagellar L-ring protein precursor FlgH
MKYGTFAMALIPFLVISTAVADSLWTKDAKSMYADPKARAVGDIVTIVVTESSASSQTASTDFTKQLTHGNAVGTGLGLGLIPGLSFSSSQTGAANGTASQSSNFLTTISAKVTKILPNGDLQLEGTRKFDTNSEKQEITISGTVRQQDIASNNTVQSTSLANAEIKTNGKGAIGDRQREGLISKFVKFLF